MPNLKTERNKLKLERKKADKQLAHISKQRFEISKEWHHNAITKEVNKLFLKFLYECENNNLCDNLVNLKKRLKI